MISLHGIIEGKFFKSSGTSIYAAKYLFIQLIPRKKSLLSTKTKEVFSYIVGLIYPYYAPPTPFLQEKIPADFLAGISIDAYYKLYLKK